MTISVRLQRVFLYSHLFLALCAVFLWIFTRWIFGLSTECSPALFMLAAATVLYYNFHKFSYRLHSYHPEKVIRQLLHASVYPVDRILFVLAATVFAIGFCFQTPRMMITWSVLILLALSYSFPLFHNGNSFFRLREKPVLKLLVVSLVWTAATVWLPLSNELFSLPHREILTISLSRFVLVFSLCIPFEIRDERKELQRGLSSLMSYGKRRVIGWTVLFIVLSLIPVVWCWSEGNATFSSAATAAVILPLVVSVYWLLTTRPDRPAWYFKGFVDGTLLLPLVFLILFSLWH